MHPRSEFLYSELIWILHICGYAEESRFVDRRANNLFPQVGRLKFESNLLLPIIYESEIEINFYHHCFTKSLDKLISETNLETLKQIEIAYGIVEIYTNFYLQYQGKQDTELQIKYGDFMGRIMSSKFPQWAALLPQSLPFSNSLAQVSRKIRVGYVSHFWKWHREHPTFADIPFCLTAA